MSNSVTISIATNGAIAVAKGFGWFVTGSPTLFAETVHSLADVGNQVLLKVGEVRGRGGPDHEHPFGRGQEKYFWALVSAVSVFFIGCGINLYHGIQSLLHPAEVAPFTPLVVGLLVFALALESWTFRIAWREIGGRRGLTENRNNTTVLAVLLEDGVALFGILLTLLVAGAGYLFGPHPEFDATVAIVVALILGAMAVVLAALNRRVLIDASDQELDRAAQAWLREQGVDATVRSLVLDNDRAIVFVRATHAVAQSHALGQTLKTAMRDRPGKRVDQVYWKFDVAGTPAGTAQAS
ncbi:MAG: cation diffusion facilitator family transporter [Casimicrobiaceae bacterium]